MSFKNAILLGTVKIILLNVSALLSLYLLTCCTDKVKAVNDSGIIDSFYLQKTNPVHNIVLSKSFLQNPPEAVQFEVTVQNKKLEAFSVNIFITDSAANILVGSFTAYPPDKGGSYVFRINQPVKQFLSENYNNKVPKKIIYFQFALQQEMEISNQLLIGVKQFQWIEKLN